MKLFDVYPVNDITIDRASGSHVWDDLGQKYLDMYGGHAVISIGHSHPHWVKKITDQLNRIAFYSNSVQIPLQKQLAEKLGRISGKEDYQLFLCNSGAEANENALKLASFHTGREKVISFAKGFHGRTSLAVEVTDNPAIVAPVNSAGHSIKVAFNDEAELKSVMTEKGHSVAAIIVESIQGVGGIREATDSFLKLIRNLCDQYGSVLIADEVQCGYGRTGEFFAVGNSGVQADIYTMAKGMGNGFPIGGIMIHPQFESRYGMLGTTFGGNHLACAAALAVLEVMEQEDLMQNARQVGNFLIDSLKGIPEIENVRGRGLMIGFDVPDWLSSLRKHLLWQHQIFTGEAKTNVIRLLPSLALSMADASFFINELKDAISKIKNLNKVESFSIGS